MDTPARESRRESLRRRFPPSRPADVTYEIARLNDIDDVYALAYRAFYRRKYVAHSTEGRLIHHDGHFDLSPDTTIFIARRRSTRKLVGTLSVTLDGPEGLPAEEDFPDEIDRLRKEHRTLYHIWRFAMDPEIEDCQIDITYGLISLALFSEQFARCTGSTAIVHPRHVPFYRSLECGPIAYRTCARGLSNAPAVLIGYVDKRFQMTPDEERQYGLLVA